MIPGQHQPDPTLAAEVHSLKGALIACYERLAPLYAHRTRAAIRDDYLTPLLTLPRPALVLDAGCGGGDDALVLANAGHRVIGVDLSPAMCDLARQKTQRHSSIEVRQEAIEDLECGTRCFDAVLSALEVFHHCDLQATIRRYSNLIVDGGLLVLITNHPVRNVLLNPQDDYFHESLVWEDWGPYGLVPKYRWTLQTYVRAIADAGLLITEQREYPPSDDLIRIQDSAIAAKFPYPSLLAFICRR